MAQTGWARRNRRVLPLVDQYFCASRRYVVSRPWTSDKPGSRAASGIQLTVDAGSARNLAAEPASLSVNRAAAAVSLAAVAYTRNAHLMPAAAIRA